MPQPILAPPELGDQSSFGYSFAGAEIRVAGTIYPSIGSLKHAQKLEEGIFHGAGVAPLGRTIGQLSVGEGSMKFNDLADAMAFCHQLSAGGLYTTIFNIAASYTAPSRPTLTVVLKQCRILDFPIDSEAGADAIASEVPFSFLNRTINGAEQLLNIGLPIANKLLPILGGL